MTISYMGKGLKRAPSALERKMARVFDASRVDPKAHVEPAARPSHGSLAGRMHAHFAESRGARPQPFTPPAGVTRRDARVTRNDLRSTPSGGVRAPASIARDGVQIYRNPDGSERREYRPPEEVFHADALASLASAPVTRGHPAEGVNPSNWERLAIGHVSDKPPGKARVGGQDFVTAELAIQKSDAITDIEAGKLVECSAGYTCTLDPTPGKTPNGERYDAIQRTIRFNHVALGPENWARAGSAARIHLDDRDTERVERMSEPTRVGKIRKDGDLR